MLYHASPVRGLDIIRPQRTLSKDKYIGDFVFATADKRVAAMYLSPKTGGSILINTFNAEPFIVINNTLEAYREADKGGSIYSLPADTFNTTPQQGLESTEVVSTVPVTPSAEDIYTTSLEAMLKMGVHIYFVKDGLFSEIRSARDHGLAILSQLKPYL